MIKKEFNIYYLVLTLLFFTLASCGGGSSGTGSREYEGRVISTTSEPLPNVTVGILGTINFGVTDEAGNYMFSSTSSLSTETFILTGEGFVAEVTVENLPSGQVIIIDFEVDDDEGSATTTKVESRDDDDDDDDGEEEEEDDEEEDTEEEEDEEEEEEEEEGEEEEEDDD